MSVAGLALLYFLCIGALDYFFNFLLIWLEYGQKSPQFTHSYTFIVGSIFMQILNLLKVTEIDLLDFSIFAKKLPVISKVVCEELAKSRANSMLSSSAFAGRNLFHFKRHHFISPNFVLGFFPLLKKSNDKARINSLGIFTFVRPPFFYAQTYE